MPPRFVRAGIFEGYEIVRQGRADLNERSKAEDSVGSAMGSDEYAMEIGIFGNPFQFGYAPYIAGIGADDAHRLPFDQILEVLPQVNLLAGMDGRGGRQRQFPVHVCVDI